MDANFYAGWGLVFGGNYNNGTNAGAFKLNFNWRGDEVNANIGGRLALSVY